MKRDIRETSLYQETEALLGRLRRPGSGLIADAAQISSNGTTAVFTGSFVESLIRDPVTRVCLTDLSTGDTRVLTFGPSNDRSPKLSPSGQQVAFLSDRHAVGEFQLYLLDLASGATRATANVAGWVEYLHWSPDGLAVLLGVGGPRVDRAAVHGAASRKSGEERDLPTWLPDVNSGDDEGCWRSAWVYDLATGRVQRISPRGMNVWEAVWCGNGAIAAIASNAPGEGEWYSARLHIVAIQSGETRLLHTPSIEVGRSAQLGCPSASPSGHHLAIVEAICSDRWLVAGELKLLNVASGAIHEIDTRDIDVSYTEWRSERHLLVAGHRGLESVIGLFDLETANFEEVWKSHEITPGDFFATICGVGEAGDCVFVGEGFKRGPEIATICKGEYRSVRSFDLSGDEVLSALNSVEALRWQAPDGLEIEGWLLKPRGVAPFPLITAIHGGPVWHWRPSWVGRNCANLMLLKRGYALFLPNPRGSTGRGRDFVRRVVGDMGGADTFDYLSGIDHLVAEGIADPERLGVTGVSYGGFMSCWLITQDQRFKAAVSVSPIANYVTEHLLSNVGPWVSWFLEDHYRNPGGKYFRRSPISHANGAKAPTLIICGALDRCTPPEEAVQLHNALRENDVETVLVKYPEEGHGVRRWPAVIDYAARHVGWFEKHLR